MSDPCRPPVPPIAWFAVALAVGCVAAERAWWAGQDMLLLGAGASLLCACALAVHFRKAVTTLCCLGLLCGGCLSALQGAVMTRRSSVVASCGAREWTAVVEADPQSGAFGPTVRVRIKGGPLDGARVRLGWPQSEELPELGRVIRFSAILKPLPREEAWARRSARAGICATGTAWRARVGPWRAPPVGWLFAWREGVLQAMHRVRGPGGDLLEGIVLGDRRRLTGTRVEQDFQVLGLTHLVAVSGSHLALACGAIAFLGAAIRLPKRALVIATLAAGAAYAVVTGLPYSALRSLLMLAVGAVGQLTGRRGSGIASLSAAVVAVLALEPWTVFDLGFQLSVLAVGGLLLFGSLATEWMSAGLPSRARLLAGPLGMTVVAQLATTPVVASAFGMISVLAPVANAVGGALVSIAMLIGLGGALVVSVLPAVGGAVLRLAATVLSATAWLASLLAALPSAAVAIEGGLGLCLGVLALAVVLWALWPLPASRAHGRVVVATLVVASLALALGPAPPRQATITVLDVGQGDAILVQDSGRSMLVDAGPNGLALREALARVGLRRVDVLVLTHDHADHTGGLQALLAVCEIGWVGTGRAGEALTETVTRGSALRRLEQGDTWQIGDTQVRVLWPTADAPEDLKTNDTSVVLQVTAGAFDAVLTGDAEAEAQQGMAQTGALSSVEVLKVPHHGSTNGLTAEGLAAWSPQLAVISVGVGNDFGHPSAETLAMLADAGVRLERTDEVGDVEIAIGPRSYRVAASRGGRLAVRARMHRTGRPAVRVSTFRTDDRSVARGSTQDRSTETGEPDLRRRGPAGRARPPPAEGADRRGSRPRLQLRVVRGRVGGRQPHYRGSEHPSVRL